MKNFISLCCLYLIFANAFIFPQQNYQDPPPDQPQIEEQDLIYLEQNPEQPAQQNFDILPQQNPPQQNPPQQIPPQQNPPQQIPPQQNPPQQSPPQQNQPQQNLPQDPLQQNQPQQDQPLQQNPPQQNQPQQNPPLQDQPLQQNPPQQVPMETVDQSFNPVQEPVQVQETPGQPNFSSQENDPSIQNNENKVAQDEQEVRWAFQDFMLKYSHIYTVEQQNIRYYIFRKNYFAIYDHNANPNTTYKMGINQFADMIPTEFQEQYLMTDLGSIPSIPGQVKETKVTVIDWRDKLHPIRNQGRCACSWAFAANSAIESNYQIQKGKFIDSLSEQQLVDCYKKDCRGTYPKNAYIYIQKSGIAFNKTYPYFSDIGIAGKCKTFTPNFLINSKNPYTDIDKTVSAVSSALTKGPISIVVDARTWRFYKSGVFNNCPKDGLIFNHAATLVGIEKDNVWVIRNSWGNDYGENGYLRLQAGNNCGILSSPRSLTLLDDLCRIKIIRQIQLCHQNSQFHPYSYISQPVEPPILL